MRENRGSLHVEIVNQNVLSLFMIRIIGRNVKGRMEQNAHKLTYDSIIVGIR